VIGISRGRVLTLEVRIGIEGREGRRKTAIPFVVDEEDDDDDEDDVDDDDDDDDDVIGGVFA